MRLIKLLLYFIILLSTVAFAEDKTLLTIKIYSEPHDRVQKLLYRVTLPKDEYYSYYLGSDLPDWHVVKQSNIQGEFRVGELVNIRIHPASEKNRDDIAFLTVIDAENSRIIWQGELQYGNTKGKITAIAKVDNKKYYDTTLKIDSQENTVWLETSEHSRG